MAGNPCKAPHSGALLHPATYESAEVGNAGGNTRSMEAGEAPVSAVRHHTVARFLLDRFARDTDRCRRICQLEIPGEDPKQISPRDATISKHFYSIDIAEGRSQAVEEALGQVESVAAPHVRAIGSGEFPVRESRAELALSWLWLTFERRHGATRPSRSRSR
jgi:hypothetical protein